MFARQLAFDDIDPSFSNTQVGWICPSGKFAGENLYFWHPGGLADARAFVDGIRQHGYVAWVVHN